MERLTNEEAEALIREYRLGTAEANEAAGKLMLDVSQAALVVARANGVWRYQDISDIQQECCLTAAKALSGKIEMEWVGFVNCLCGRRAVDYIRTESAWREKEKDVFIRDVFELPNIKARRKEVYDEIATCLDMLLPQEKMIVDAVFWAGEKERDIARRLGVSQQRVSQKKKEALVKLKDMLGMADIDNSTPWEN